MDRLAQDFRFGLRTLSRSPGFTAVAVITLAVGIGINTAVFSLVNAFLLRPLPQVEDVETLVAMFTSEGGTPGVNAYMDYLDFAERSEAFAGLASYKPLLMDLSTGDNTERVQGMIVSANYFDVLGVEPAAGRFFALEDDDEPDGETAVVLGYSLWQERFAGAADIVGKQARLNGRTFTVVGVAPAGFRGTYLESRPQVFATMMMQPHFMPASGNLLERRGWGGIFVVGRLGDGVGIEQAGDSVAGVAEWIIEQNPQFANWGREYTLVPLHQATLMPGERNAVVLTSSLLMGIMGLVLLVACVNVANLMLTRSVRRRSEIAIRQALGADRVRLFRQLLVESLTLGLLGGAAGLLLAQWGSSLLRRLPFPLELDLSLDARVLGFALIASLATGVVFGLAPAFRAARVDLSCNLRPVLAGGATIGRRRMSSGLVIVQVALSMVLLIVAGLFARTLINLGSIELGFDADNVLAATVDPGLQGYEGAEVKAFYDRLMPRIEAVPGVVAASLVSALPGPENDNSWSISLQGYTPEADERLGSYVSYVASDYFETIGIPIMRGRGFTAADDNGPPSVVINETAAELLAQLTGRDALGGRIGFDGPDGDFVGIIGIAGDSKVGNLRADPRPQTYLPHAQVAALGMGARMSLLVRTGAADPLGVLPGVRTALQETDPNVPVFDATTLEDHLSATLVRERLSAALLGLSAALALLLAGVGLYGVLSYSVARRTKEMGIRIALGARSDEVRLLVVRHGLLLVAIGVVAGVVASAALAVLLSGFLYGVTGTDPLTYAGVVLVIAVVALAASYVPARRATRVDPLVALRSD